jgi:hypothetical protein
LALDKQRLAIAPAKNKVFLMTSFQNVYEAEVNDLLAKVIVETDPRRRRAITLRLDVARKLAERAQHIQKQQAAEDERSGS